MLSQGQRKHFSFGQVKYRGGVAGLENGLELWNGLWNKKTTTFFHSNTQLYCIAICLLTYS